MIICLSACRFEPSQSQIYSQMVTLKCNWNIEVQSASYFVYTSSRNDVFKNAPMKKTYSALNLTITQKDK